MGSQITPAVSNYDSAISFQFILGNAFNISVLLSSSVHGGKITESTLQRLCGRA